MKPIFIIIIIVIMSTDLSAQNKSNLPYHEIPPYPESFTAENVAARMVDGLGYRYYWATEGLRAEDLAYKPSENGRNTEETLDHILGLTYTIVNAPQSKPNKFEDLSILTWEQKRRMTLENIYKTSELLKSSKEGDMENFKIIFQNGDNTTEFPYWNMLNGPIADAIYHVGQVVSFRRSSGNPIHPGVRVFTGKTNEKITR